MTLWASETRRPLNHYEKVELNALLYYAAHTKTPDEKSLRRKVEEKLGVDNFDGMTERDYIVTRRYLQNAVR